MKQKTYSGYGIKNMLNTAHKYGLYKDNAKLYVKDKSRLDSFWRITLKD